MNAVLALAALAVAQSSPPELVTLPLSVDAVDPQSALSAWNLVSATLDKRARSLNVSTSLQQARHEFLMGPAREQARDCGRDVDCLAEIGAALGAELLVVGIVSNRVALVAIRVADRSVLAKARSPKKGSMKRRAKIAAIRLAKRLGRALRKAGAPQPPILAPPGIAKAKPPPPEPPPPEPSGLLYIHRDRLTGVSQVTLDGAPVDFTGEGFISWPAASGPHTLRATHIDGRQTEKTVVIEAGQTTEVALRFPAAPSPPPSVAVAPPAAAKPENDDVTGTWWFWTAVGTAVVAGAATAAILASGSKGGPTPPSDTGTIQGTY